MKLRYAGDILGRLSCIQESVEVFFTEQLGVHRPSDMTHDQMMMIYRLSKMGTITATVLHESCYTGSNVSYNLSRLVERGYVTRKTNRQDKRSVVCALTAKGQTLAARLEVIVSMVDLQLGEFISQGKTAALVGWFETQPHGLLALQIANAASLAPKQPQAKEKV